MRLHNTGNSLETTHQKKLFLHNNPINIKFTIIIILSFLNAKIYLQAQVQETPKKYKVLKLHKYKNASNYL
jgi:hypothetical protein